MKNYILTLAIILTFTLVYAQNDTTFITKGYILSIENGEIFLDYTKKDVQIGDMLKIVEKGSYMTHPVTGVKIKKKDKVLATLKISEVEDSYSIAVLYPSQPIEIIKKGMRVIKMEDNEIRSNTNNISIAVESINVVGGLDGGYLGIYMNDLLTKELYKKDKFTIVDRTTLDFQINEVDLYNNDIDIQKYNNIKNVDFLIIGTAYPPDVIDITTGIPLKNILGIAEGVSGKNLGSDLISNVEVKQLKAIVKVSLRIIDARTGEIVFMCTEMQEASGKSSIGLEGGAMSGLQLNGGVTDFLNTVSGKASKQALINLSDYVVRFFNGEIKNKTFEGNIVRFGNKSDYEKSAIYNSEFMVGDSIIYFSVSQELFFRSKIEGLHQKQPKAKISGIRGLVRLDRIYKIDVSNNYIIQPTKNETTAGDKVIFFRNNRFIEGIISHYNSPTQISIDITYKKNGIEKNRRYNYISRGKVVLIKPKINN